MELEEAMRRARFEQQSILVGGGAEQQLPELLMGTVQKRALIASMLRDLAEGREPRVHPVNQEEAKGGDGAAHAHSELEPKAGGLNPQDVAYVRQRLRQLREPCERNWGYGLRLRQTVTFEMAGFLREQVEGPRGIISVLLRLCEGR